jgi:hypothetical protein
MIFLNIYPYSGTCVFIPSIVFFKTDVVEYISKPSYFVHKGKGITSLRAVCTNLVIPYLPNDIQMKVNVGTSQMAGLFYHVQGPGFYFQ